MRLHAKYNVKGKYLINKYSNLCVHIHSMLERSDVHAMSLPSTWTWMDARTC